MRALAVVSRFLLALTVLSAWAAGAAGEVVAIPGTKVSIEPPSGFVVSSRFPGVESSELGASIMVSELPAPPEKVTAGFTAEMLLSRGMTLRSSEETTLAGQPGRLLAVTQTAGGVTYEKWMAAFGNATATVLVVATYPQAVAADLKASLRAAVLSATWKPEAQLDPFEGLSFRIRESEHLKIQNRVQNMLLLATGPGPNAPAQPFAVVASSFSPVHIDDLELFARQRIAQTAKISDLKDLRGTAVEVAGRPAYEILAKAKDLASGTSLAVYQLVLVVGDTYYLMQAMVGESQLSEYLPEFRAIAFSLETF